MPRYSVIVTTETADAEDARDLVRWALEASEALGPCEVAAVPGDCAVVDRARFERLREYVAADLAYTGAPDATVGTVAYDRYAAARAALESGDIDEI